MTVVMRSEVGDSAASRRVDAFGVNWDRSRNHGLRLVQDVDNMIGLVECVFLEEGVEESDCCNRVLLGGAKNRCSIDVLLPDELSRSSPGFQGALPSIFATHSSSAEQLEAIIIRRTATTTTLTE